MARTIGRRKITVTIAAGPAATPISSTNLFATDIEYFFPLTNGAASGFIGSSAVDNTWIPRPKGQIFNMVHGTGTFDGSDPVTAFNLAKIFVLANAGDKCIVEYMAFDLLKN